MGYLLELLSRQLAAADRTLQIGAMVGLIVWIVSMSGILFRHTSGIFPSFLPTSTVRMLDVNVEWEQIIVAVVGFAAAGALFAFLRFTRRGLELRAVVDDPDLLSVTGTSSLGVRRLAWIIGSSFAALSGLLIAPNLQLSALALTLLVVQAFSAAAIGYFTNLPLTYVGGLLTGVAGAVATKYVVNVPWLIGFPSSLPFVVLFIVLLVTPRGRLVVRSFVVARRIPPSWHAPTPARVLAGLIFLGLLCRLQATPPRAVQDFLDRISANPFCRARPRAVRPAPAGPEAGTLETGVLEIGAPLAVLAPRPPRPAASTSLLVENLTIRYGGAVAVSAVSLAVRAGLITGSSGPTVRARQASSTRVPGWSARPRARSSCTAPTSPTRRRHSAPGSASAAPSSASSCSSRSTCSRTSSLPASPRSRAATRSARSSGGQATDGRSTRRSPPRSSSPASGPTSTRRSSSSALASPGWWSWRGYSPGRSTPSCSTSPRPVSTQRRPGTSVRSCAGPWPSAGIGVLLVEHDMALVQQTCAQVYVLDYGSLIFVGTPQQMLTAETVRAAYLGVTTTEAAS